MLSPGILPKPSKNMGKGYRCSPFLKAHLKICLLMAVIILENSSPVASETERAERASTDLRGLGKAHDRQKCFPTLISPFCQITPCVDMRGARWLWEVFSQNNVYSILGAELRKKCHHRRPLPGTIIKAGSVAQKDTRLQTQDSFPKGLPIRRIKAFR